MRPAASSLLAALLAVSLAPPSSAAPPSDPSPESSTGALGAEAEGTEADGSPPEACRGLPPDLERICSRGHLRVARYSGQRPPFFSTGGDGTTRGFDVDLARDIAGRLGVGYLAVPAESFDRVVDLVATGEADLGISKLSITLERAKRVRFTKPYMTVYQTLLVNRLAAPKQQDPFRFLNRSGVRLGALAGSSYMEYAEHELPAAELRGYDAFERMMADVTTREVDAVFVDSARANTWRRANPEKLIQVRAFVARDRRDPLAIAVHWADERLLAWLDLYLDSIRDDGSAERLYRRWFTDAEDAAEPVP